MQFLGQVWMQINIPDLYNGGEMKIGGLYFLHTRYIELG